MRLFSAVNYLSLVVSFFIIFPFSTVGANDLTLFGSAGCPQCERIETFLKANNVDYKYYDVEDEVGYSRLLDIEAKLGIRHSGDFPAVFIQKEGTKRMFYHGVGELKDSIIKYLNLDVAANEPVLSQPQESAVEVTPQDSLVQAVADVAVAEENQPQGALNDEKIYIVYFYEAGCPECVRITRHLNFITSRNDNVVIKKHYMKEKQSILLNEVLSNKYGVPYHQRLMAPSVFTSAGFLPGEKSTPFFIDSLLAISTPGIFWQASEAEVKIAEDKIFERFQAVTVLTVIAAGLLDGINPCAFAVLIFLISYLMVLKRDKKTVLLAGLFFTAGVFTLYFSAGLGFSTLINYLHRFGNVSTVLNFGFAGVLILFAILNLSDYFAMKNNRYDKVKLSMSNSMSKRMHDTIKKIGNSRFLFLNSFIVGFVMSLFELTCTGQVYLPTIIYMQEVAPERALFLLFLFNLMFVTPMLLVFLLIYKGATASALQQFMRKSAKRVKLGFFFLFSFMATVLILSAVLYG